MKKLLVINMVENKSLDRILTEFPKYEEFIDSVEDAVSWVYEIVNDFNDENINIVSHLADADGFGSQIVFQKGLELILDFFGNSSKNVQSDRIMNFSRDENSSNSLKSLVDKFGKEGKWIVTDLATFNPHDANKYLDECLIVDHHNPKDGFDSKFNIVNPHLNGHEGGVELSASMISTLIINRVYERVEEEMLEEIDSSIYDKSSRKKIRANLNKLRKNLDYISLFGLAGSKADMQEDTGLNKAMYEYLENRQVIKKINSPFFGYYTKDVSKVWAQSTPYYNFKYSVVDIKNLNKGFENNFKSIASNREKIISSIYDNFKWVFVDEGKEFSVNSYYLNNLDDEEILKLNNLVFDLTGQNFVDINYDENDEFRELKILDGFRESSFEVFDNKKVMSHRILDAESLIRRLDFDPQKSLVFNPGLNSAMIQYFKDNLIAFGEKEDLNFNLDKLNGYQYVSMISKDLAESSISETANFMTAMSKLRKGDLFLKGIEEILVNETSGANILKCREIHDEYKFIIYNSMKEVEAELLAKENFMYAKKDKYFMNVDFLKSVLSEFNIDLRYMNGVLGGIASGTALLPSSKGIFFTGTTFEEISDGGIVTKMKISGRATDSIKYQDIRLDKFMGQYGGGGHKRAAACVIPMTEVKKFTSSIEKFDFYKGEFK